MILESSITLLMRKMLLASVLNFFTVFTVVHYGSSDKLTCLLIIYVSCHLFQVSNDENNYACLLVFFVFRKQCIREAVAEMQTLTGSQPKEAEV